MATRRFVGFGFGAIQAGLFLHRAQRSGAFAPPVVAYRRPEVIAALRSAGGIVPLHIAHADRIERVALGPIDLRDVNDPGDREALVEAIAEADEIATALGSVDDVRGAGAGSVHRLLARGLARRFERGGKPGVLYAAENRPHAAALLLEAALAGVPRPFHPPLRERLQAVDTVIGKMSGALEGAELAELGLAEIAPGLGRAFLVEAFDRILIDRVRLDGFAAALGFEERDDLRPFEEAKLYGHNAAHALLAYLGRAAGLERIAEARERPELMALVRGALVEESGGALLARHAGADPLFTPAGFAAFADDLLERMTNPLLRDGIGRVGRDPRRKLGWDDRLIGTIRMALAAGIAPHRYALGGAAALEAAGAGGAAEGAALLRALWAPADATEDAQRTVLDLIEGARPELARWRGARP